MIELPTFARRQELDITPSREKVTPGKAPGEDGLSAEIFKHGDVKLSAELHKLTNTCWHQGVIQQGLKDVTIIPIFKNKGDHRDCGNYRGIVRKRLPKIVQDRLAELVDGILTESQCGFRRERSTFDMVLSLRELQEKAVEHYKELYIVFIDFRKAFDMVDSALLWKVLNILGCPPRLAKIVQEFHDVTKGRVAGWR